MAWLSGACANDLRMVQMMPLPPLMPAYSCCPGKEAFKWVSVCLSVSQNISGFKRSGLTPIFKSSFNHESNQHQFIDNGQNIILGGIQSPLYQFATVIQISTF